MEQKPQVQRDVVDDNTVHETVVAGINDSPAAPEKKKFLMIDIPEGSTLTKEQAVTILKMLKSKNYLPMDQCVALHAQLTDLDNRREELGEDEFKRQLTDVIQNTLSSITVT